MPRSRTGSLYPSRGNWFVALTLEKRTHFYLGPCSEDDAKLRQAVLANIANRLKEAKKIEYAEALCRQAATADERTLADVMKLVDGVIAGKERRAPTPGVFEPDPTVTVGEFGERWTTNTLARLHRGRVKPIDHTDNISRLKTHVYPISFKGRTIEDTALIEFTLDHADYVLAQPTLPDGSLRHVAQVMHRLLRLAVYPARVLAQSPFPPGWLPGPNEAKEKSYVFPSEDAAFLANTRMPLVRRLLVGFCNREGPRKENARTIEWSNLTLEFDDGAGHITLDKTKNGRGGSWALDSGTAEGLRRWKTICPSTRYVFPAEAVPGHYKDSEGEPMYADHLAAELRAGLFQAGVTRAKLFERGENRLQLRAHDLRASFVTLSLANGRSEDWVVTRTGHRSSSQVARYRREAATAAELNLGWFKPLYEAIPELAAIPSTREANGHAEPQPHLQ
jgi:integrase